MTNKKEGNGVETFPSNFVCNHTFTRFVQNENLQ
jgi:hypothetical protein